MDRGSSEKAPPLRFEQHEKQFMNIALAEAWKALQVGEVPVGCALVHSPESTSGKRGSLLATGSNRTNLKCDATCHAEFEAMQKVLRNAGGWGKAQELLRDCVLFVTVEPCIMCAAALARMHIKAVYFGCRNPKFGGNGSILSLHDEPLETNSRAYPSFSGLMADEAVSLLREFYGTGNPNAPKPQRAVVTCKPNLMDLGV